MTEYSGTSCKFPQTIKCICFSEGRVSWIITSKSLSSWTTFIISPPILYVLLGLILPSPISIMWRLLALNFIPHIWALHSPPSLLLLSVCVLLCAYLMRDWALQVPNHKKRCSFCFEVLRWVSGMLLWWGRRHCLSLSLSPVHAAILDICPSTCTAVGIFAVILHACACLEWLAQGS